MAPQPTSQFFSTACRLDPPDRTRTRRALLADSAIRPKRRLTIISNNLCAGSALSALSLARALRCRFEPQIIGTMFGTALWPALQEADVELEIFPGAPLPAYFRTMRKMLERIQGDLVIAHQLRLSSFGVAMLSKLKKHTPCALYIDDDDIALTMPGRSNGLWDRLRAPNGDLHTRLMHRLRNRADVVFCGSDFFSEKFGGITVPLGRDPSDYDPDRGDRDELRHELNIRPTQTVIGFIGNPRPHVGIEDLVQALEMTRDPDCILLVVPATTASEYASRLFARIPESVRLLENQPSKRVPAFLAASDIVVVPQRTEAYSLGQLPARVVEAMAMGKPIVTTRLADLPRLLGDGAVYVEERSPAQIAEAIRWIRQHPQAAAAMGRKARAAFLRELSLDAMAERLVPPLEALAESHPRRV